MKLLQAQVRDPIGGVLDLAAAGHGQFLQFAATPLHGVPMNKLTLKAALACMALAIAPLAAQAPQPPQPAPLAQAGQTADHPAYLHVLDHLRHIRALLLAHKDKPQGAWDEGPAVQEINATILAIHNASIEQGVKPPGVRIDPKLDYPGRLRRAAERLQKAQQECQADQDAGFGNGLQARVLDHLGRISDLLQQGLSTSQQ